MDVEYSRYCAAGKLLQIYVYIRRFAQKHTMDQLRETLDPATFKCRCDAHKQFQTDMCAFPFSTQDPEFASSKGGTVVMAELDRLTGLHTAFFNVARDRFALAVADAKSAIRALSLADHVCLSVKC